MRWFCSAEDAREGICRVMVNVLKGILVEW